MVLMYVIVLLNSRIVNGFNVCNYAAKCTLLNGCIGFGGVYIELVYVVYLDCLIYREMLWNFLQLL
ncbi:hypothetical protein RND81_05G031900 [Saponaria officinalis]|uniref:Uncharacterized protein n=1 Tax=Saponaria officinalis TaxID=3572 RepID=A0AAW1KT98_SAPOF